MTMSLSGFSFFGPDIGGFSGPKPGRELFMRWLQYGVFLPRFVLHSWKPGEESTMPWLYPDMMDSVRAIFDLRQRLVPYLSEQMERCAENDLPLITPVFLRDPDYDREAGTVDIVFQTIGASTYRMAEFKEGDSFSDIRFNRTAGDRGKEWIQHFPRTGSDRGRCICRRG